jgi:Cof subfamily protein (haloacid dehalogenase superfamily)
MNIKLIALDLDGTIFADDLIISERMRQAIRQAQGAGVIVTIATGRMFRSARQIAEDLDISEHLICYQGAMLAHSATGEVLYHKAIPLDFAQQIIAETARRGLHLNLYLNDNIYVSRITPEAEFYSRINMDMPLNEVGDLSTWLDTQGGAEPTKLVIVTDAEQTDRTLVLFTELYGDRLQVTKSHPRFTEFTNAECSKGRALAFLAGHYNIPREQVMAIGDGHNDLDMIAWAGYGVAMSTSPQAVLSAARIVTGALAEDGAARAIQEWLKVED